MAKLHLCILLVNQCAKLLPQMLLLLITDAPADAVRLLKGRRAFTSPDMVVSIGFVCTPALLAASSAC